MKYKVIDKIEGVLYETDDKKAYMELLTDFKNTYGDNANVIKEWNGEEETTYIYDKKFYNENLQAILEQLDA